MGGRESAARVGHGAAMNRLTAAVSLGWRMREKSPHELAQRAVRRLYARVGADALDFPLLPQDIADSTRLLADADSAPSFRGGPMRVGWLCSPPTPGSGGHTTMFRMVQALERAGHECEVVLYDRNGSAPDARADVIRIGWPGVAPPSARWTTASTASTSASRPSGRARTSSRPGDRATCERSISCRTTSRSSTRKARLCARGGHLPLRVH